ELKARENKYRNLFKGSKDAVFISDKNLFFTECNHTASLLFGCNNGDLLQHSLFDFIKDETQKERVRCLLEKEENASDIEVQIMDQQGEIKPCLLSISFQRDAPAHQLIHGIIHDITNMKKAELANLQAQKLAANERLVRILAHEIRNPLNNITLAVDQLKTPNEDEEIKIYLVGIVQRNAIRINKIITELLDVTKPLELKFEKHSLQEILDDSLTNAADRI